MMCSVCHFSVSLTRFFFFSSKIFIHITFFKLLPVTVHNLQCAMVQSLNIKNLAEQYGNCTVTNIRHGKKIALVHFVLYTKSCTAQLQETRSYCNAKSRRAQLLVCVLSMCKKFAAIFNPKSSYVFLTHVH